MALLLARSVQMCVARSTLPLAVLASSSSSSFARCFSSDAAATPAAASTEASAFQAFASSNTMQCDAAKRLVTAFATDAPDMRVGRSWTAEELRVKSFEDLHKLWYVLLIERNRLETIRGYCRAKHIQMPNHTRVGKVRQSMARIKFVLGERTRLFNQDKAEIIAREKKAAQEAEKVARTDARQAKFEADKQAMVQKLLAEQSTQTPSATL